jgi:hypothetical protein
VICSWIPGSLESFSITLSSLRIRLRAVIVRGLTVVVV